MVKRGEIIQKFVEKFKSFILFLLILLVIILALQTFAYDTLYPGGMSFLGIREIYTRFFKSGAFDDPSDTYNMERYLWPASLSVLSGEGDRTLFFKGDSHTLQINSYARLFAHIVTSGELVHTEIPFEEAILGEGMLLDLGRELTLDAFAKLTDGQSGTDVFVRELLLQNDGEYLILRASGLESSCYRIKDASYLNDFFNMQDTVLTTEDAQPIEVSGRTAAFFQRPGKLYPSGDTLYPVLVPYNPLYQNGDIAAYSLTNALGVFNYNIGTLRRDVEDDGSIVYVENYSSIRLSPNGKLEYKASDTKKGIPVSKSSSNSADGGFTLFDVITFSYSFLDSFSTQLTGAPAATLRYMGAEFNRSKGELLMYFDYVSSGVTIKQAEGYAVEIAYNSGYITEAKIFLRGYGESEQIFYPPKIRAPYTIANKNTENKIKNAEFLYIDRGDEESIEPKYIFYE